jgi:hypothetical protein
MLGAPAKPPLRRAKQLADHGPGSHAAETKPFIDSRAARSVEVDKKLTDAAGHHLYVPTELLRPTDVPALPIARHAKRRRPGWATC